jgi:hypothetical protein
MQTKTPAAVSDDSLKKLSRSFLDNFTLSLYRMQWLAAVHALPPEAAAMMADHLLGGTYD